MSFFKTSRSVAAANIDDGMAVIRQGLERICAGELGYKVVLPAEHPNFAVAQLINNITDNNVQLMKSSIALINDITLSGVSCGDDLNSNTHQFKHITMNLEQIVTALHQLTQSINEIANSATNDQCAGCYWENVNGSY